MKKIKKTIPESIPDVPHVQGHSVKISKINPTLADWERYLELMARLVIHDPVYIPIFKRVEAEIARVTEEEDVIARARKIAAMSAKQG